MTTTRLFQAMILAPAVVALVSACSAKVSSSGGDAPAGGGAGPAPVVQSDAVVGPKLDGKYQSACTADASKFYRLIYEFKDHGIIRTEDKFDDAACSHNIDFATNGGQFHFMKALPGDVFAVQYHVASSDGFIDMNENIQLKEDSLLVSHLASGDAVLPSVELLRLDANGNPIRKQPTVIQNYAPRIGQSITFHGLKNGAATTVSAKIISASGGYWQVDVQGDIQEFPSLPTRADAATDLNACASKGGTRVLITVPAGTYDSCKLSLGGNTLWMATAPIFGYVKVKSDDGSTDLEMISVNY